MSLSKIASAAPLPVVFTGILTAAPTGATPTGLYVQIGGTPPAGVSLGDSFAWSGSAASVSAAFADLPSTITVAGTEWGKAAGTWIPANGLTVQGIMTAAPVAGTVAGLWATNVAFGPAAAGDLVYLPGGVGTGTKYLSFANAPASVPTASTVLFKAAGAWIALGPPAGSIQAYGGTTAPAGYYLCDGSAVSRTANAALFTAIGTAFGAGDGSTTFNLPDLRGVVLRGVDGTAGRDPDKASRIALLAGGNTGNAVGSYQADQITAHAHPVTLKYKDNGQAGGGGNTWFIDPAASFASTSTSNSVVVGPNGGNETRSKNVNVNYIIKT